MDTNFTLNDLAEFAQQEQDLFEALNAEFSQEEQTEFMCAPSVNVINNILGYSKALSVRKSKTLDHIEMILN